jgi:uncharacterized membrane protein YdbT with pleckstrin-like domain
VTLPIPAERTIARLRPHARALIVPTVVLLVASAALGYLSGRFPEAWQNVAVAATAVLVLLVGWAVPALGWMARSYTITTRRTIVCSGILRRVRREIPHSRVLNVTVSRSALQVLFGAGDVQLGQGAGSPAVLRDVPRPRLVADALHELIDAAGHDTSIG